MAIQVCYSMPMGSSTSEREIKALMKLSEVLPCRRKLIVTYDEEAVFESNGHRIELIPAWKFVLEL